MEAPHETNSEHTNEQTRQNETYQAPIDVNSHSYEVSQEEEEQRNFLNAFPYESICGNNLSSSPDADQNVLLPISTQKALLQHKIDEALLKSHVKLTENTFNHFQKVQRDALNYIGKLNDKLSVLSQVLNLKLVSYSEWYDRAQVMVIVLSSLITTAAAVEAEVLTLVSNTSSSSQIVDGATSHDVIDSAFSFFIIGCSLGIALLSAISKFKGWKGKANKLSTVYASCVFTSETLQMAKEKIKFATSSKAVQVIMSDDFLTQTYSLFLKTMGNIKELLPLESQASHLPKYFGLNLITARSQKAYEHALTDILSSQQKHTSDLTQKQSLT